MSEHEHGGSRNSYNAEFCDICEGSGCEYDEDSHVNISGSSKFFWTPVVVVILLLLSGIPLIGSIIAILGIVAWISC